MGSAEGLTSTPTRIKTTPKSGSGIKEEDEPLSPMARLFHEPGSNVYIITMMGCKTKINPDVVKQNLGHSLLRHPRFSSLQVIDKVTGSIIWVPTQVDIENHVIVPKLEPDIACPDKFVDDYISNLSKSPIENSKPLWDLHLLDIKTTNDEGTGVFRFHHSLGDGMSLMTLLLACTRKSSDLDALPTLPVHKDSGYIKYTSSWSVLELFWNSFVAVLMFVFTVLFLKDTETPLKGPEGVENRPRRFVRKSVNLADIKAVKNAMDVTLNDVVLGVTQAGLSRYLNRRYSESGDANDLDHDPKKNEIIPKNIRLRATFFFNLRATTKIDALMIHIMSYMDKLTFVISADEQTIPDPQRLCDDLEESLHIIKTSALASESAKNK